MIKTLGSYFNIEPIEAFVLSLPVAYSAYFLGEWRLVEIGFLLSCTDLVVGIADARKHGTFDWTELYKWVRKVTMIAFSILMVGILAHTASIALQFDVAILNIYVAILIGKETASIIFHLKNLDMPVPEAALYIVYIFNSRVSDKLKNLAKKDKDNEPDINEIEHKS